MSYDAMRDAVRGRFVASGWTSATLLLDGFNLDETAPSPSGRYFRARIEGGAGDHVGIAGNVTRRRHFYVLVSDYFAPVASGDSTPATDIQALLDRFDRWSDGAGVVFNEPGSVREIGSEDGVSHLWRVFQPFYYEETR